MSVTVETIIALTLPTAPRLFQPLSTISIDLSAQSKINTEDIAPRTLTAQEDPKLSDPLSVTLIEASAPVLPRDPKTSSVTLTEVNVPAAPSMIFTEVNALAPHLAQEDPKLSDPSSVTHIQASAPVLPRDPKTSSVSLTEVNAPAAPSMIFTEASALVPLRDPKTSSTEVRAPAMLLRVNSLRKLKLKSLP